MLPSNVNLVLVSSLLIFISSGYAGQTVLRGVQTSLLSMYVPSKPFTCLDGSATIPFELVNDDYCDCQDGSDEPGTSACPNGQFFCENKGYVGTLIPSHFVGDGICDCCDGSDEYETKATCANTCFELAQKVQAERAEKQALHEAGVKKKKEIIAKSAADKAERQMHLNQLQQELKQAESELKIKEEKKTYAEIPENAAKERQQKIWDEQRAARELVVRDNQIREMFADLDTNGDSLVSIDELQKHTELDFETDNEFTSEEARSILGADSVNLDDFNTTVFDQISNSYKPLPEPPRPTPEPIPLPEPSLDTLPSTTPSPSIDDETTVPVPSPPPSSSSWDDNEDFDDHYHEDEETNPDGSPIPTSIEHQKHIHTDIPSDYDESTKILIQIAEEARNEYHEAERKVVEIRNKIEGLTKQNLVDIGPQGEYSAFIDQCYDYEEREYTYRICMFKDARQISKGGGSDVTIGYWDSWSGPENKKYSKMKYANGATCWNGPARSITTTLKCGLEHKIIDVREPSRCEYAAVFETPSACDENIAVASQHPEHVEF